MKNYISSQFVQKVNAQLQEKKESYSLQKFDKSIIKYHDELVN